MASNEVLTADDPRVKACTADGLGHDWRPYAYLHLNREHTSWRGLRKAWRQNLHLNREHTSWRGLRKAWRQMRPSGVHYDVTLGVRAKAVRAGAVELEAGTPEWMRVAKQARIQYWEDRLL